MINYYSELELDSNLTIDELEEEIKALQKKWIRRQTSANQEKRHEAENKIQMIADAKDVLLDPASKRTYDDELYAYENQVVEQQQTQQTPTSGGYYHISDEEFEELVERYWVYADANDYSSALAQSQHLTTVAPDNFLSWFLHGYSNRQFGNNELSIGYFNKAIEMNPSHESSYVQLGVALLSLKRRNDAYQAFQKGLQINPNSEIAIRNTANLLLDDGQVDEAISLYEKLIELRNDDYSNELLAQAYYKKGEYALPHYESGYYFYEDDKIEYFIEQATKANELYPSDFYAKEIKNAQKAKRKTYDWSKITLLLIPLIFSELGFLSLVLFGVLIYFSVRPTWEINRRKNHGVKTTFDKISGVYTKTVGFAFVALIGIVFALFGASINTKKWT